MVDVKKVIGLAVLGLMVAVGIIFTKESCVSKSKNEIVRGNSLSGLIEDGKEVKIWRDYYKCRPVRRNDIVVYQYAGNLNPLIKIVKGMPGDRFELEQADGGWYIKLNGKRLVNSQGEPYRLTDAQIRVLELYAKDYQGIIPSGAYLLFGNIATGSLDSTRFGLVSGRDITAKVVKVIK